MIGDSGWLGVISAPASFTALKVVPGGVFGGRLSIIRLVWFTTSKIAIERAAAIVAITTGFRSALSIPINVSVSPGFRSRPWRGVVVPSNWLAQYGPPAQCLRTVARALSRAQRADAALMILRRRSTLRSRNHLDQNYKPSLHHFIFDGGVGAQQSEAENAVGDDRLSRSGSLPLPW